MSENLEVRISVLEERQKTSDVYHQQVLDKLDKYRDEMRKMHEDHYVKAEDHGIAQKVLETDFHNLKGEVQEHINSRWKWVVGLGAILGGIEALTKFLRKLG